MARPDPASCTYVSANTAAAARRICRRGTSLARLGGLLAAVLALVLGCSGPGGTCRGHKDCRSGLYCAGPNDRPVCGIPPREHCADSSACGAGAVCHAISDSCSPDGVGSECDAPCTAASCGPGFRCSAAQACEPVPCDEGFACPGHQRCDPVVARATGPVHARTPGCVDIACTADAACPTGKVCVNSICQDGAGSCREDLPVP